MRQLGTTNTVVESTDTPVTRQSPRTTQLLLARLAIESALQHNGLTTAVSGHQILIQGKKVYTLIEVQPANASRLSVQIRSFLGEVLLAEEAQAYVKTARAKAGAIEIALSDDGVLTLFWHQEFDEVVDPAVIVAALEELCQVMSAIHTTLREEFYLQPLDKTKVRAAVGGAQ